MDSEKERKQEQDSIYTTLSSNKRQPRKGKKNANWILRSSIVVFIILIFMIFTQLIYDIFLYERHGEIQTHPIASVTGFMDNSVDFVAGVPRKIKDWIADGLWSASKLVFDSGTYDRKTGTRNQLDDGKTTQGNEAVSVQKNPSSQEVYDVIIQNPDLLREVTRLVQESDPEGVYEVDVKYPYIENISGGNVAVETANEAIDTVVEEVIKRFKKDIDRNQVFESSLKDAKSLLTVDYDISENSINSANDPVTVVLKPKVVTAYTENGVIVPSQLASTGQSFEETVIVTIDPETGETITLSGFNDKSFGESLSDGVKTQLRNTIGGYICEI